MPSLMVVACPVCGAPLETDSSRCGYCGSIVVIQTDLPRLEPHLLNKAIIHDHIGKYRSAVRQDINDETAHYGLGLAYFNLGLLEEAGEELAQAARLMPENPHIQIQLAVVYEELAKSGKPGFEDLAWDRLRRVFLLDSKLSEASLLKAEIHLRKGEWNHAVNAWRKAASEDPDSIRKPIAAFLSRHKSIFVAAPQFKLKPPSKPKRRAQRPKSHRHTWLALVTFFGLFILLAVVSTVSDSQEDNPSGIVSALILILTLLMLTAPFVIYFKLRPKPSTEDINHAQLEAEIATQEQRAFLSGTIADAPRMVNAAAYVVDVLVREEKQREADQQPTLQRARKT